VNVLFVVKKEVCCFVCIVYLPILSLDLTSFRIADLCNSRPSPADLLHKNIAVNIADYFSLFHLIRWRFGFFGIVVGCINEVNQRRARLVRRWMIVVMQPGQLSLAAPQQQVQ